MLPVNGGAYAKEENVEPKKINLLFYLVVLFFLAVIFILIRDLNAKRAIEFKEYSVSITNVVKQKNNKIMVLYKLLVAKEKENEDLKNTLAETRNGLAAISNKLAQPAPAAAAK